MNAHPRKLDSPAALIEMATTTLSRISRIAPLAGPESRTRLMGELSLVGIVLDGIEHTVHAHAAYALKTLPRPKQLPKGRRALPKGGAR